MVTITEDYCDFETAKLLKEKTFNGLCNAYYDCFTTDNFHSGYEPTDFNSIDTKIRNIVSAPTIQMARKWLGEVHNIFICIIPSEVGAGVMDYTYVLYKVDTENFYFTDLGIQGRADTDKMSASKTCEAAIKYCLKNLI